MSKKHIVGIVGSPRKGGNTSVLIQDVLDVFPQQDYEKSVIYLRDYKYSSCIGCEKCAETNYCHLKDDMQKIYPLIESADAIVMGSPVYHGNVTAWIKAFIDRLYCYYNFHEDRRGWASILGKGRPAVVIGVGEQTKIEWLGWVIDAMKTPLRDLGFNVLGEYLASGHFKAGSVCADNQARRQVRELGNQIITYLDADHQQDTSIYFDK